MPAVVFSSAGERIRMEIRIANSINRAAYKKGSTPTAAVKRAVMTRLTDLKSSGTTGIVLNRSHKPVTA